MSRKTSCNYCQAPIRFYRCTDGRERAFDLGSDRPTAKPYALVPDVGMTRVHGSSFGYRVHRCPTLLDPAINGGELRRAPRVNPARLAELEAEAARNRQPRA
jgi:hypothetical protein